MPTASSSASCAARPATAASTESALSRGVGRVPLRRTCSPRSTTHFMAVPPTSMPIRSVAARAFSLCARIMSIRIGIRIALLCRPVKP